MWAWYVNHKTNQFTQMHVIPANSNKPYPRFSWYGECAVKRLENNGNSPFNIEEWDFWAYV